MKEFSPNYFHSVTHARKFDAGVSADIFVTVPAVPFHSETFWVNHYSLPKYMGQFSFYTVLDLMDRSN
jgi:hypothetical protein